MLAFLGCAACAPADPPADQPQASRSSTIVGTLENNEIDEASGLARSQVDPDVLWLVNDDGPAVLHAIDSRGNMLARVKIADTSNRDWEDLASFTLDGVPYLLLADIGDNAAKRKDVRFYVIEEPALTTSKVDYAWRVDFSYPGGPRDAEAIAVDVENESVLVLTKRDIPARLYSVPLQPDSKKRQVATRLGVIGGLPQATAMDISGDGKKAVILTDGGVFLFTQEPGEDWIDAMQRQPVVVSRTRNRAAEAIAFDASGNALYITLEQRNAPLFRLPIDVASDE